MFKIETSLILGIKIFVGSLFGRHHKNLALKPSDIDFNHYQLLICVLLFVKLFNSLWKERLMLLVFQNFNLLSSMVYPFELKRTC